MIEMDKEKKLVRKTLAIVAIAAIGTSFAVTSPSSAKAEQINTSKNVIPNNVKFTEQSKNSAYQNLDERLTTMLKSAASWYGPYGHHTIRATELTGSNIENSIIENSQLLTVGEDTFENTLGHEITYRTTGYEHEFQETTSTTNTSGWTFGYNYNASLSVMGATASHQFSVDYNMSTSNTIEKSQKRKFTVPSQEIPIPSGKKYKVEYRFEKLTISGSSRINADLFGDVTYMWNNQPLSPNLLYSALNKATNKQGFEQVIRDTSLTPEWNDKFGVRATGIGAFRTEFGTRLIARISDVTDTKNPVTVQTKTIPVKFETISENIKVIE
ncbi:ETX/MTX2 family pore-forming toxin [Bacillus cereus]|nr:ETX/MTX2 family pore-forming toxin [Bacillus cereus]